MKKSRDTTRPDLWGGIENRREPSDPKMVGGEKQKEEELKGFELD